MSDLRSIPRALIELDHFAPGTADETIVAALPYLEEPAKAGAIELIVRRGHVPALSAVVGSFHTSPPDVQRLVIQSWRGLEAGFRAAVASASFERRASAIEAIVASDAVELAYLLADALKGRCERTRALSSHALTALADSVSDRLAQVESESASAAEVTGVTHVVEALGEAVHSWELHQCREVLEAALRVGVPIVPALRRKLARRPVHIDRPINDLLGSTSDPRLAEMLWCALALPELRPTAGRRIETARDPDLIRALLRTAWLVLDPAIASGWAGVRSCPWIFGSLQESSQLTEQEFVETIRLIESCGAKSSAKLERFEVLWREGGEPIRRAVMWALLRDRTTGATELLGRLLGDADQNLGTIMGRELEARRRLTGGIAPVPSPGERRGEAASLATDALETLFAGFEQRSAAERRSAALAYQSHTGQLASALRKKLRASNAKDRRHALTLIRELGRDHEFHEEVCHLAHDHDARTRSLAVAMLAAIPGATSQRLLRRAVDDVDERVQANAIEAIDRQKVPDRVEVLMRKLEAPGNRVRANAVQALMRLGVREAFEVLLAMLSEASAPHRISALWVVERSGLETLLDRIDRMSALDPDERVRTRASRVLHHLNPLRGARNVPEHRAVNEPTDGPRSALGSEIVR